ncbi:hypothetical protein E5288_WYG006122 [Bos mutus]|uniref:Uncharacterized protein n=1 Tax=Bos mutus TaxID=72004 RepID=A0A6B0S4B8_9CETA|nr:hypothetical protein [Bos mutus]
MGSEKKLNAAMAKQNQKDTLQRQDVERELGYIHACVELIYCVGGSREKGLTNSDGKVFLALVHRDEAGSNNEKNELGSYSFDTFDVPD